MKRGKDVPCFICKKSRYFKLYKIKNYEKLGYRFFCSRQCQFKSMEKAKVKKKCFFCREEFSIYPSTEKWNKIRKRKHIFCSTSCRVKFFVGANGANWKGGRVVTKRGYVLIHVGKDKGRVAGSYVYEHRLTLLKTGVKLSSDIDVHHLNKNKTDNSSENLSAISSHDHARHHIVERLFNKKV